VWTAQFGGGEKKKGVLGSGFQFETLNRGGKEFYDPMPEQEAFFLFLLGRKGGSFPVVGSA